MRTYPDHSAPFLVTGLLAMLIALVVIGWAVGFVQKQHGRLVLLLGMLPGT